jgi:tetratricopeptide (TPR) repeat protein
MLETIREYALEKMIAAGEEAAVRRAHAAYCLVLAEEGAAEDDGANRTAWLDRFEIENDNLRSALEWLLQKGNADWGLRLGAALFRFWEMREHLAEGREWFARLLKLPASGELAKPLQRVLFAAGVLAGEQGDYAIGDTLIAESLQLARAAGDDRSATICINARAIMARNGGDLPSARLLFEESLAIWRQLHDTHAIALALSNLASIVKLQEDYPRARALYEECLAIFAGLRDNTGIAWALNHQGDAALQQGDFAAARALYQQSLQKFRELQDRWGIAGTLADLGNLAREQRQFVTSDALYRESLEIFRSLEHKRGVARLLEAFACSFAVQSQAQRALRLAGAAVALREGIGAPLTPIEQAKFERGLEPARKDLSVTAGRTAWLEGWVMPVELAIQDVLASASGSARPSA